MAKAKKGIGFAAASESIQKKEGLKKADADAILAASARRAGVAAKRANPNLARVVAKKKK